MKIITALPKKGETHGTAYVEFEASDVGRRVRLDKHAERVRKWVEEHGGEAEVTTQNASDTGTPLVPAHATADGTLPPPHHHVE